MKATELEKRYEELGTRRGGELFLRPRDAASLVAEASASAVAVIGIEGFVLTDTATTPLLDQIADYSRAEAATWRSFVTQCNQAAQAFLREQELSPELRVTLVMLDESEWTQHR